MTVELSGICTTASTTKVRGAFVNYKILPKHISFKFRIHASTRKSGICKTTGSIADKLARFIPSDEQLESTPKVNSHHSVVYLLSI